MGKMVIINVHYHFPLDRLDAYILYLILPNCRRPKGGGQIPDCPSLAEPLFISTVQGRSDVRGGGGGKIFSKLQHLNKIVANRI